MKRKIIRLSMGLALPAIILCAWQYVCSHEIVPASMLAPPMAVASDFVALIKDGSLLQHCLASLQRLLLGFTIGTASGAVVGILLAVSPVWKRVTEPTLGILAPIPPIAWVPFVIMLLGVDNEAKVALIALGTFFIMTVHTVHGIRSTNVDFVELCSTLRKKKHQLLLSVLLPSALPEMFTGMRVSMGLCWTLLLVSEIIASSNGLGWLIWDARNFSRPDDLIVGMITVGVLGRLTDMFLVMLERFATRWRFTYADAQV